MTNTIQKSRNQSTFDMSGHLYQIEFILTFWSIKIDLNDTVLLQEFLLVNDFPFLSTIILTIDIMTKFNAAQ